MIVGMDEKNNPARSPWQEFRQRLEDLIRRNETFLCLAGMLATLALVLPLAWVLGRYWVSAGGRTASELSAAQPALTEVVSVVSAPAYQGASNTGKNVGISRTCELKTVLPLRLRDGLMQYAVEPGDNLFSIAEKFGLRPETVLWGNRYTLGDDPHFIYPGQVLQIMPVDGTLHKWSVGEGLNGVAAFYHVSPEVIINYPANSLNAATIGDYTNPNIPAGHLLIIPGGTADFPDWRTPRITRETPATAQNVGPGACSGSYQGVMGTQNFAFPVKNPKLSGYDFSPVTNHYGIDLGGNQGDPILAAENGVVVYAGWNDWGYGEMVVIDHGNGWQSLYAHLAKVEVKCGQELYRGDVLGAMGATGNANGVHLHFELRSDQYGRVNPWDFLH